MLAMLYNVPVDRTWLLLGRFSLPVECVHGICSNQVTQARHLHSSGSGQQLEAVAVEAERGEARDLSFFRTREREPV